MTWTYSPDPDVEAAVAAAAAAHPQIVPAGLQRFTDYLRALGDPHLHMPPVFHVAGTNGKGSTLAFLQAIYEAGGKTVHKFTSPHLVRFEERIVVGGKMIAGATFLSLVDECRRAAQGHVVSFFELFTAVAFLAFSRAPADATLLETGLGGLLDSTNVVEKNVALLTRVSFDHMHVLGDTLPAIAAQKAGIIKRGCPAVLAPQPDAGVTAAFEKQAAAMEAKLFRAGHEWSVREEASGFVYESAAHEFRLPPAALKGAHQVDNAGTAIAALEAAGRADVLKQEILASAMRNVVWPGRMQRLVQGPMVGLLPEGWEIWLDGAHNDSGAAALAAATRGWGGFFLITALKYNKDPADIFAPLKDLARATRVLDADIGAPLAPAAGLCAALRARGFSDVSVVSNLETAVRELTSQSRAPGRILVAGSLYLAGYVLRTHS